MFTKKILERKKITALIVSLILLFIFSFNLNNITIKVNNVDDSRLKISALTPPIDIDELGGGDYTWEEAADQDWCSGSGTDGDPYLLENLIINGSGTDTCISIQNSDAHFIIRNCTLFNAGGTGYVPAIALFTVANGTITENNYSNNERGIAIDEGFYIEISNNYFFNTFDQYGIRLQHSDNNTIVGNEIIRGYGGMDLFDSNNTIISENIVKDNVKNAIRLSVSFYNNISGNTVQNNSESGIYLSGSSFNYIADNIAYNNTEYGIQLIHNPDYIQSNGSIITNNILEYNKMCGILLNNASENQILNNVIRDNPFYGAVVSPKSVDNLFSENFFVENDVHAGSWEANNDWNTTTIGNYWDNHTGPDTSPKDGIVDNPYTYILGSGGNIDHLPIAEDGAPVITINSPSSDDAFSTVAPSFNLTVTDLYWEDIWYTIDGGLHNYSCSETDSINQAAYDVLSDDHFTLTFYASDIIGNTGSNFVSIAKDTTAPIIVINSPADGEVFGNTPPSFNISFTDSHLDSVWYSVDDGLTVFHTNLIYSDLLIGTINQTAWSALPQGSATITFYANDTLGHSSSEEVTITKDLPSKVIGLDYFMTGFLIALIGGVAIITIIAKIHFKKRIISH